MQLTSEKIEATFVPLLQHDVKFMHRSKTLKRGKILLVSQKGSYVSFVITDNNNQPKMYELPYPFVYTYHEKDNSVTLSYKIRDLCNENNFAIDMVTKLIPEKPGRFFEKKIKIISIDNNK